MDKRGGGEYQDFLSKNFLLTLPKNFVREPFRVSLFSVMEKFFASPGYVSVFDFLSKFFCLTVLRNFVGNPFSVSLLSGAEKIWIREGGGISRFSVEKFLSHSAEKFRR